MRVCYATEPVKSGRWILWRSKHWHTYRTNSDATVPAGATEIKRGEPLPVSDEEIVRAIAEAARLNYSLDYEQATEDVRGRRYDPGTHDWMAWAAPLDLTAEKASERYVTAMTTPKTLEANIVLRPCLTGGWFAWIGLGTLLDAVLRPDLAATWGTREEALGAAYSVILEERRECMAEIERILDGWEPEAVGLIRSARVPVYFGVVPWSTIVYVHEGGPSGTSSWDLPVVERLPGEGEAGVEALRASECDPAARKLALRQRKNARNRQNKLSRN